MPNITPSKGEPCNKNSSKYFGNSSDQNARKGDQSGEAAGLVYSLTSDTQPEQIILNPRKIRVKRLRRTILNSARLHEQSLQQSKIRYKAAFLTLTYADGVEWSDKQITECMKCIREYLRRRGYSFRYVWVMELTKKGRPHYHIVLFLPKGVTIPKPDKQGWWKHGHTEIKWARKPVAYLAKYASKMAEDDFVFPPNARIHGCGGLNQSDKWECAWWNLPSYVRKHQELDEAREKGTAKRAEKGGFIFPDGFRIPALYDIISFNPVTIIKKTQQALIHEMLHFESSALDDRRASGRALRKSKVRETIENLELTPVEI